MLPRIEVSEFGEPAATAGAVRLALDDVEETLYGVDVSFVRERHEMAVIRADRALLDLAAGARTVELRSMTIAQNALHSYGGD